MSTGDITNNVRNSDKPSRIWFDGVDCVPSAWRRKLSTIMMRVNDVIISSTAGRNVSTVISASSCSDSVQFCAPPGAFCTVNTGIPAPDAGICGMEGMVGMAGAAQASSGLISRMATRIQRNDFITCASNGPAHRRTA